MISEYWFMSDRQRVQKFGDDLLMFLAGGLAVAGLFLGFLFAYGIPEATLRVGIERFVNLVVTTSEFWLPFFGMALGLAIALVLAWVWAMGMRVIGWVRIKQGWGASQAGKPALPPATPSPLTDNLNDASKAGSRLDTVLKKGQRLDLCAAYISVAGLERLVGWLDALQPTGKIRFLLGMEPEHWQPRGSATPRAAAYFLAQHLKYDKDADSVLQQLEQHRVDGRLEIRLRMTPPLLHSKLFSWTDAAGQMGALVGSSNLTKNGLHSRGELNIEVRDEDAIQHLNAWFDARWHDQSTFAAPDCIRDFPRVLEERSNNRSPR